VNRNYIFNTINSALPALLETLLREGRTGPSRNGQVKEIMYTGITLEDPRRREITIPGRKANIAAQIAETMWVLAGRNDVDFLSHYLPRAADFSDDGKTWRAGYGPRLRKWYSASGLNGVYEPIDQFRSVYEILRRDPDSRQAVMSIWDPAEDYRTSKDIPCNNWLSWSIRDGRLDLMVAIRSNDLMWGWSGINAFEWSAMQEVLAGLLDVEVGSMHFATTSLHLYEPHWQKGARIVEQSAMTFPVPTAAGSPRFALPEGLGDDLEQFDSLVDRWFRLEYDIRTGSPLVDGYVRDFPEPMMRSWLRVLQWWWSYGDTSYLAEIEGTDLERACRVAMQPKRPDPMAGLREKAHDLAVGHINEHRAEFVRGVLKRLQTARVKDLADGDLETFITAMEAGPQPVPSEFLQSLETLHLEKEAAYGGSWKKRGEFFSILPNIGRKIDRLGNGETDDETQADTAGDLFVYLAKYRTWLSDQGLKPLSNLGDLSEHASHANTYMEQVEKEAVGSTGTTVTDPTWVENGLKTSFDHLLRLAEDKDEHRWANVEAMAADAYRLARYRWEAAQAQGDDYRGADVD